MAESMAEGVQERYSRSMQLQQEFCCDWGKDTLLCGKCSNDSFTSRRDPLTEPDSVPLGGDVDEPGEPTGIHGLSGLTYRFRGHRLKATITPIISAVSVLPSACAR
jgi:hypothetical protein